MTETTRVTLYASTPPSPKPMMHIAYLFPSFFKKVINSSLFPQNL